jgi:MGT family glycosyltransferase
MLAVIAELVRRGHDVVVANRPEQEALITAAGARFVSYPDAIDTAAFNRVLQDGNLVASFGMLVGRAEPLTDFSLNLLKRESPDLVVIDAICIWGAIAARRLKLPTVSDSTLFVYDFFRQLSGWEEFRLQGKSFVAAVPRLAWCWIRLALRFGPQNLTIWDWPLVPVRGNRTVLLTSRDVHPPTPVFDRGSWDFAGASIDARTRNDPFDFSRLDGRPLVLVSLGTIQFTNDAFFRTVMETFADYPAQFVLSAGTDPERLGPPPANFIVQKSIPQLLLLERAAAFLTHGGLGSMQESLWHGVPMVGVPQQFEQMRNLRAASDRGAAIVLDAKCFGREVSGPALRTALDTVLKDPGYRDAARRLGDTLKAGGGYARVADIVEEELSSAAGRRARRHRA